jgi:hypothetical protein
MLTLDEHNNLPPFVLTISFPRQIVVVPSSKGIHRIQVVVFREAERILKTFRAKPSKSCPDFSTSHKFQSLMNDDGVL